MIRSLVTFTAGMVTSLLLMIAGASTASAPAPVLHGALRIAVSTPCPEEDSVNCYWDAGTAGNGRGHSFYSIRVGARDCVIYWDRAYNRSHGHCYPL